MPQLQTLQPGWVYLVGAELAILLVAALLFLLVHVRGLRGLIAALEARVLALRGTLRGARGEAREARRALAEARRQSRDRLDLIDEQIAATHDRHWALGAGRDIGLDLASDTPLERQALALRHALLVAESAAWQAGDGESCDWDVLTLELGRVIDCCRQPGADVIAAGEPRLLDELVEEADLDAVPVDAGAGELAQSQQTVATLRQQIANLEKFRTLYFEGEKRWREASAHADACHDELRSLGERLGAGDEYQALLQRYRDVYADLGAQFSQGSARQDGGVDRAAQPSVGRLVIANQEEIQRLRNMAVDQHKVIVQLKRQLLDASSLEEKDRAIAALHQQLERQERFLKESDTCTQLLEDELERTLQENQQLKQQLAQPAVADDDAAALQRLVGDLTRESRDMLGAIAVLEDENRRLQAQLQAAGGDDLKRRLSEAQQALLDLQTRHVELEERYLELKIRDI